MGIEKVIHSDPFVGSCSKWWEVSFMQLIRRITDREILGGGAPEFVKIISCYGSRGVLIDDMLNDPMMYM